MPATASGANFARQRRFDRVGAKDARRRTGDRDADSAGVLGDEDADQRIARRRAAEFLVGRGERHRESHGGDDLARRRAPSRTCPRRKSSAGDRALVGRSRSSHRARARRRDSPPQDRCWRSSRRWCRGCEPADRRCRQQDPPARGSRRARPPERATSAWRVMAPTVTTVAVDLDSAQSGKRAEVDQRRAAPPAAFSCVGIKRHPAGEQPCLRSSRRAAADSLSAKDWPGDGSQSFSSCSLAPILLTLRPHWSQRPRSG